MAVNATSNTGSITLNPNKLRYGLFLTVKNGAVTGDIALRRSDKRQDDTWLDDPRPDSAVRVPVPQNLDLTGLKALVPILAQRSGITAPFTNYGLTINSILGPDSKLIVRVRLQAETTKGPQSVATTLNEFLSKPANQDVAAQFISTWDAVDAAVDAANAVAQWL